MCTRAYVHSAVWVAAMISALLGASQSLAQGRGYPAEQVQVVRHLTPPSTPARPTVWVGYSSTSTDPNKVGVGGKWDWDTDIAGTDSLQFWSFWRADWRYENLEFNAPLSRPTWHLDYGNEIDNGNTNLWAARQLAGRKYRRTGVVSAWHRDDFGPSVPAATPFPGGPAPLAGAFSAWCGLRATGDTRFLDELTGNALNGGLAQQWRIGSSIQSTWPGYGDQWDQILYRDVPAAAGALTFTMSADMSTELDPASGGSGWYGPDPTSPANYQHMLTDVFRVWVGLPKDVGIFDPNRRWLSDVIDFGAPPAMAPVLLFSATGVVAPGVVGPLPIPALGPTVRIAFEVKTNRVGSDEVTGPAPRFDSSTGAVVLDDIFVGATKYDFEAASSIRPRALINSNGALTFINPATAWIATGRPVGPFGHVLNVGGLPYDDVCGGIGSATRHCDLNGNVLLQSNLDHLEVHEAATWSQAVSPTIRLHAGNSQGIVPPTPGFTKAVLQYDFYSGFMGIDEGTFWEVGASYMRHDLTQPQGDPGPAWSGFNMLDYVQYNPSPSCFTETVDLSSLIPLPVDSLRVSLGVITLCGRFGSSICGNTSGAYWDNVRFGLVDDRPTWISAPFWAELQDAFPKSEDVAPGTPLFDRLTADLQAGLNNSNSLPAFQDGVIPGDSAFFFAPEFSPIRVDFVFRILPGPGNYSVKGNRTSPLLLDPAVPGGGVAAAGDGSFWGEFIASNGDPGFPTIAGPNKHGVNTFPAPPNPGYWDPHTWNSARMDRANPNLFAIPARGIGEDRRDYWQATLNPADPKFVALGKPRGVCFLVDPNGPVDFTNTCCSGAQCAGAPFFSPYPPAWAAGAPVVTTRGTKILPDNLFTPGTHIEYFVRLSTLAAPGTSVQLSPDTSVVSSQSEPTNIDRQRWANVDVLPDCWKDTRFGGTGLACLLWVDAGDRRGEQPAVRRTMDMLGYGANNGASAGWRQTNLNDPNPDPDDPGGFVRANLGQDGLAYDRYDIQGAESFGGGRPGCRLAAPIDPAVVGRQCKAGPSSAMLDFYYSTLLWSAADIDYGALHDGNSPMEHSNDVDLTRGWLSGATGVNEKALWASGDGIAGDLANSAGNANNLLDDLAAVFVDDNYFQASGNLAASAIYAPLDVDPGAPDPFHSGRRYGFANPCTFQLDVVEVNGGMPGGSRAGRYEDSGDRGNGLAGPFRASVYRKMDPPSRFFTTLLDGFSLSHLLGWGGPADPQSTGPGALSGGDYGRMQWANDALVTFGLCARVGPIVAVGDVPGLGGLALNFVRGVYPNPVRSGVATVEFTLSHPAPVTIRFYDVAGRLLYQGSTNGIAGRNRYQWRGTTTGGALARSGTYFCRLSAPGIAFTNNAQRIVFLH